MLSKEIWKHKPEKCSCMSQGENEL